MVEYAPYWAIGFEIADFAVQISILGDLETQSPSYLLHGLHGILYNCTLATRGGTFQIV